MTDNINHPLHYTWHPSGVECATIAREFGYNLGTVIAYVWRAGFKSSSNRYVDLRKAAWHLQNEIEREEKILVDKGEALWKERHLTIQNPLILEVLRKDLLQSLQEKPASAEQTVYFSQFMPDHLRNAEPLSGIKSDAATANDGTVTKAATKPGSRPVPPRPARGAKRK